MKKIVLKSMRPLLMVSLLSVFSVMSSCSKDNDDNTTTAEITEDEAADLVATTMAKDSNGMSMTMETSIETAQSNDMFVEAENSACGQTNTESYSQANVNGNYSYNYSLTTSYTLYCTNVGFPDYFTYDATLTGVYDTPRMSSDDSSELSWTVTGLPPSNDSVVFNGSYERQGTQISKVFNMNTFSSTLTIDLTNVTVNKTTYMIESGTATVNFVGTSSSGNQYTYTGSITFNGDGTANLVINGNAHIINL